MTGKSADDEPRGDSGMVTGREMQRGGSYGRLTGVVAEEVQADRDPDRSSADNLVSGNVPEEDGVEHRSEPHVLADGDAEASLPPVPDVQGSDADRPAPADDGYAGSSSGMSTGLADPADASIPMPTVSSGNGGFAPAAQGAGAGAMRMP